MTWLYIVLVPLETMAYFHHHKLARRHRRLFIVGTHWLHCHGWLPPVSSGYQYCLQQWLPILSATLVTNYVCNRSFVLPARHLLPTVAVTHWQNSRDHLMRQRLPSLSATQVLFPDIYGNDKTTRDRMGSGNLLTVHRINADPDSGWTVPRLRD